MEENCEFIANEDALRPLSGDGINSNFQIPSDPYDLRGLSEDKIADKIPSVIIKDLGWNT